MTDLYLPNPYVLLAIVCTFIIFQAFLLLLLWQLTDKQQIAKRQARREARRRAQAQALAAEQARRRARAEAARREQEQLAHRNWVLRYGTIEERTLAQLEVQNELLRQQSENMRRLGQITAWNHMMEMGRPDHPEHHYH